MKGISLLNSLAIILGVVQTTCALGYNDQQQQILAPAANIKDNRPNIIFILVDDQDLLLDSINYMPNLNKHLAQEGTFYRNHFVTTALCCPSRVSLLTGRLAHNTNVTDVNPPYGGYPKFVERGFNENYLPVWLQNAGYNTLYTGKLFNAHTVDNYNSPFANGFNSSDFLLDPYTYSYLNATFQRDSDPPVSYEGQYTTDILKGKALDLLESAISQTDPFFLTIAPVAPHSNVHSNGPIIPGVDLKITAPISAERHKHLFKDVKIPRTPNFNPDEPSGVNWIARLPKQNESNIDYNDHFYRSRLRALQPVDELISEVVDILDENHILDNTYIIYTSDNGYHIGQHRLQAGKECGFEEDIRVPFIVRGPGVLPNYEELAITTHIDIAPTLFDITGLPLRSDFDGTPIPFKKELNSSDPVRHEHVTVEYWGLAIPEGKYNTLGPDNPEIITNNTYKSIRILSSEYDLYYSVWCSNEHQLYDLKTDPYELNNLYVTSDSPGNLNEGREILGVSLAKVIHRLDALLLVLKSCQGQTCIRPWDVLHPEGKVETIVDALDAKYDEFYNVQSKVSFSRCEFGYILDAEGPQTALTYRDGIEWHHWV
ncbi:arylsulfatase [Penicillium cosmopolitanum]|uniref:Arylsulfatase n=1 Tax=Penicillium cosmopolitanum TaxID=1131564 RepID=A0A9W9W4T7_9EURO|nr:arylsulfatase [Penicillium cosmopolitanum]KAJ5403489.1 arylsulfatase [Penicillium cosmopolitanum]